MRAGDHRPHLRAGRHRITDDDRADRVGDAGDEIVVHLRSGDHPARGGAVLAGVVERRLLEVGDHRLDVCVVEHDHRGLATEFEVDALEGLGGGSRDRLPCADAAGQRHHRHVGVLAQRHPRRRPRTTHDVEDAGREDVGCQLGQLQRRVRRELGGLEDDGVAGRQRRPELPRGHVERVVPRRDRSDHTDRVTTGHRRVALEVLTGGLALQEARRSGEEPPVVDREVHLELDDADRLAHVLALDARQLVDVGRHHLGHLTEDLAALPGRRTRPAGERRGRGLHGGVDVGGIARRHLAQARARCRVEYHVGRPRPGRPPLTADEIARHSVHDARSSHAPSRLRQDF